MLSTLLNHRYQIQAELGQGGVGIVYQARDTVLNRDVAVKILTGRAIDPKTSARFLQEARAVANFNHPNIAAIYDFGEYEGAPYIVMELVPGGTLAQQLPVPFERAVPIAYQVCLALEHAHKRGVVHRDVKPENVLFSEEGVAKLVDFGVAHINASRLTIEGDLIGTLGYMAPEQISGGDVDERTDLYAVGVLLYELTTGAHPFESAEAFQLLQLHLHSAARPPASLNPAISQDLDALILNLLEKDPQRRPASASEVIAQLRSYVPAALLETHTLEISASAVTPLPFKFARSLHDLKPAGSEYLDATHLSLIHRYPDEFKFGQKDIELLFKSSLHAGVDLDPWIGRAESEMAALGALESILKEWPEPEYRRRLVQVIDRFEGDAATDILCECAASDESHVVRTPAAVAAARRGRKDEIVRLLRDDIDRSGDPVALAAYVAIADELGVPKIRPGLQNLPFMFLLGQRRWQHHKGRIMSRAWRAAAGAGLFLAPVGLASPVFSAWLSPEQYRQDSAFIGVAAWIILAAIVTVTLGFIHGFVSCFLVGLSDMGSASRMTRFSFGAFSGLAHVFYLLLFTSLELVPEMQLQGSVYIWVYLAFGLVLGAVLAPVIPHYLDLPPRAGQMKRAAASAGVLAVLTLAATHLVYAGTYLDEYAYRILFNVFLALSLGFSLSTKHKNPEIG